MLVLPLNHRGEFLRNFQLEVKFCRKVNRRAMSEPLSVWWDDRHGQWTVLIQIGSHVHWTAHFIGLRLAKIHVHALHLGHNPDHWQRTKNRPSKVSSQHPHILSRHAEAKNPSVSTLLGQFYLPSSFSCRSRLARMSKFNYHASSVFISIYHEVFGSFFVPGPCRDLMIGLGYFLIELRLRQKTPKSNDEVAHAANEQNLDNFLMRKFQVLKLLRWGKHARRFSL